MKAKITVTLKTGILDPQGRAIQGALESLDGRDVKNVRVGKLIEIELEERDREAAMAKLKLMCDKLLANPVTENYNIEIVSA
ncbi:MAG: phosphoribosylformylglycinamidine synthase subunit PurS [Nitrospinae bacterium]|nr:phosphoribosylformylglycinamidine synthase subunit PurS [Nitrospinota bacterium]